MLGVPSRSDLRRAGVWTNGDQVVVANGPDIAGVEREEGFSLSRRCDEFDLEAVGFIHVDDGAKVAALQAMSGNIGLEYHDVQGLESHGVSPG